MDYMIWGMTLTAEIVLLAVIIFLGAYRRLPWLTATFALEFLQSFPFLVLASYGTERQWWLLYHFFDVLFAVLFLCCVVEAAYRRFKWIALAVGSYVVLKVPVWWLLAKGQTDASVALSDYLRFPFLALLIFLTIYLWHTQRQED